MVVCNVMNYVIVLFSCLVVYCFGVCACCSARKRVRAEETGVPLHSYPRRGLTGKTYPFMEDSDGHFAKRYPKTLEKH